MSYRLGSVIAQLGSVPPRLSSFLLSLRVTGFPVSAFSTVSLPLTSFNASETIRIEREEILLVAHLLSAAWAVDPARLVLVGTH